MQGDHPKNGRIFSQSRTTIMLPNRSTNMTYNKFQAEELTPRRMNKKMLSPYMYLIHENKGKEDSNSNQQKSLVEKYSNTLGLPQQNYSSTQKKKRPLSSAKRAYRLPFEPHYNHEQNHYNPLKGGSSLIESGARTPRANVSLPQASKTQRVKSKNTVTPTMMLETEESLIETSRKFNKNIKTSKTENEVDDVSIQSERNGQLNEDYLNGDMNGTTGKKVGGTKVSALRIKYDQAVSDLEQSNEELKKQRQINQEWISRILRLREMSFGQTEIFFTEENETTDDIFDKELQALQVCISRLQSKQQQLVLQIQSNQNLETITSKASAQKHREKEEDKEKSMLRGKIIEKDRTIEELHKALQASNLDVEMISKELNTQRLKNLELDRNSGKVALESERSIMKAQGEIQNAETNFQRAKHALENEIEILKAEKALMLKQQKILEESLEQSKKKQVQAIQIFEEESASLRSELYKQIESLRKENDGIEAEYAVLLKDYQRIKLETEFSKSMDILKQENQSLVNQIAMIKIQHQEQQEQTLSIAQNPVVISSLQQQIEEILRENTQLKNENSKAIQKLQKYSQKKKSELNKKPIIKVEQQIEVNEVQQPTPTRSEKEDNIDNQIEQPSQQGSATEIVAECSPVSPSQLPKQSISNQDFI